MKRSGAAHERAYTTSLTLRAWRLARHTPRLPGTGQDQKDAEVALAAMMARAIESINSNADGSEIGALSVMVSTDDWPGFFIDMNSKSAPNDVADVKRWLKDRLLGSHLLISGQKEAFLGWANRVEHLLEQDGGRVPDLQRVQGFYTILRNLSTPSTNGG